jgi:hypothetical protein
MTWASSTVVSPMGWCDDNVSRTIGTGHVLSPGAKSSTS